MKALYGIFIILWANKQMKRFNIEPTKLIPELRHHTYQEYLSNLSLLLLLYRCQRGEMIFLYQLTHQYFNIDVSRLFEYQSSITRGHRYKIYMHVKCFC